MPVEDKKEMKSYQSLFLREFLKFKRGVPNLSHAMLIAENRRNLRWTVAFLYQWLCLMQVIKHKPRVTQMSRFVLYILRCARCFLWGCPRWDRLLVFSRAISKFFSLDLGSRILREAHRFLSIEHDNASLIMLDLLDDWGLPNFGPQWRHRRLLIISLKARVS